MDLYIHPDYRDEEHRLLRSVLKGAPHGILTLKSIRKEDQRIEDFRVIMVNRKMEIILERNGQTMIGQTFLDIHEDPEWQNLFELFKENFFEKDFLKLEKELKVGKVNCWYQISGVHYDDALTLHFMDVTDYRNAVQQLTRSERKYRNLFNESLDPIVLVDMDLNILRINRSFTDMFGWGDSALDQLNLEKLANNKDDLIQFKSNIKKRKTINEFETSMRDKGGKVHDCLIHCAPLIERIDEQDVFLTVIHDITEKKRIERDLMFAEKLSFSGKLSRLIAHEIRNPLTNINLALNEVGDECSGEDGDPEFYIDVIKRNVERMQSLINDLLNSSKSRKLELKKCRINDVILETTRLISDRLDLKKMKLELNLDQELPPILADEEQLKVALLNLFLNAVEAMDEGKGVLKIASSQESPEAIMVRIEDNGSGIKREDIPHIFDPFFTGKKEGTGIGLTTTMNVVKRHKGNIEVDSTPGGGTVFYISFLVDPEISNGP